MNEDQHKLLGTIRGVVKQCPQLAPKMLIAVAQGMEDYEAAVKNDRDCLAMRGIESMFSKNQVEALPLSYLIDAAFYLFPNGEGSHSQYNREAFEAFVHKCRDEPIDRKWARNTRGSEWDAWFQKIVEPEIAKIAEVNNG